MVLQRFAILPPLQLLHLLKKNWAGMFEISRTFTSHCKKVVCFFLAGLRRIIRRIVVFSYLNAFI